MQKIMVDSYHKCENYMNARQNVVGFHKIEEAPADSVVWRIKTCTIGGNKNSIGQTSNGYVSKNGFNPHT